MNIVIFDIDGTLADASHRIHHLQQRVKDWDSFFAAQPHDALIKAGRGILNAFFSAGFKIVLLTGRPANWRDDTRKWLHDHGIAFHQLIMRPPGCREDDDTLKIRLLNETLSVDERAGVVTIFEDRTRCVKALRAAGYHVCQVANGDF